MNELNELDDYQRFNDPLLLNKQKNENIHRNKDWLGGIGEWQIYLSWTRLSNRD